MKIIAAGAHLLCALFLTASPQDSIPKDSVPPDRMILFIFVGHSQMTGYCAKVVDSAGSRTWMYNPGSGRFHKHFENEKNCIPYFLNKMALLYPDYNFAGCDMATRAAYIHGRYTPGGDKYQEIIEMIKAVRGRCVIGGIISMFGILESTAAGAVDSIPMNYLLFLYGIRAETGNPFLPTVFSLYETNSDLSDYEGRVENKSRINTVIKYLPSYDKYIALSPACFIPREYYCDNHHYNSAGYKIFGEDCATIIQINHFDFWYKTAFPCK